MYIVICVQALLAGNGPLKRLLLRSRYINLLQEFRKDTVPVRLLLLTLSTCRPLLLLLLHSAGGKVPDSMLLSRFSSCSCGKLAMLAGMVPVRLGSATEHYRTSPNDRVDA